MALQSFFSLLIFFFALSYSCRVVRAQATIPARFDGFVYENRPISIDSITIEAFFDPICPDSRDAWPPLKQALDFYGQRVSLILHPFPLPYHDNAFVSSRALHIINKLNASATYDLLELFFAHQEEFYNLATSDLSRTSVVSRIVNLAARAVGDSYYHAVASGFTDRNTDLMTRVSFKYGCSRGVFGTPFFFVNGFALPDAGSAIDYNKWRSIIDPLIQERRNKDGGIPTFLLDFLS